MLRGLRGAAASGSRASARKASKRRRGPRALTPAALQGLGSDVAPLIADTSDSDVTMVRLGAATRPRKPRKRAHGGSAAKRLRCACSQHSGGRRIGRDLGAASAQRVSTGVLRRAAGRVAALRCVQAAFLLPQPSTCPWTRPALTFAPRFRPQPTLSAADPSPSSDAQPLRRSLLQDSVVVRRYLILTSRCVLALTQAYRFPQEAPSEASDADALVTGFTAYDIDAQISAKLAASTDGNATALYEGSFSPVCHSLCRPHASNTSLDAGRRMLELCDNCWCRQLRPCTVSPPYGACPRRTRCLHCCLLADAIGRPSALLPRRRLHGACLLRR